MGYVSESLGGLLSLAEATWGLNLGGLLGTCTVQTSAPCSQLQGHGLLLRTGLGVGLTVSVLLRQGDRTRGPEC